MTQQKEELFFNSKRCLINALPSNVVDSPALEVFKHRLVAHLSGVLFMEISSFGTGLGLLTHEVPFQPLSYTSL